MSEIPEKAIWAAVKAQFEAEMRLTIVPGGEKMRNQMILAAGLEAALPALHEKWEQEAVKRIKAEHLKCPTRHPMDIAYDAAIDDAIRAIQWEPGDE